MAFEHQCRNPEPHGFYISGAIQRARQPRFCWLCPEPIVAEQLTARCRCGNGDGTFHVAHKDCAVRHPLNLASQAAAQQAPLPQLAGEDWPEPARPPSALLLEDGDPKTGRYRVMLGGREEFQSANRERAYGVFQYLNKTRSN